MICKKGIFENTLSDENNGYTAREDKERQFKSEGYDTCYFSDEFAETKTYLTADDEEPICTRCDHFGDDFKCNESCGAKKGWYGYIRTVK